MTRQRHGHLAMLCFSALVAGSFSLGTMVANDIAPAAITAARFGLATLIVGALALATTGIPARAADAPWRYLLLGGLFGAYFVLMFEGLKLAEAVSAAAVFTLTPVMSALFGWLLLRQVTTSRIALGLAIGASGAVWVIFRADLTALLSLNLGAGEAIYFIGCIAHAIYTPLVRRLNRGEAPVVFTFGMLLAGTALVSAYGWGDIRATDWGTLRPLIWVAIAYLAIFASAATFVLLQFATLHLPSSKVMAYTYLTPSWVMLLEFALGNGAPDIWVFAGILLTIAALILLLKDDN